MTTSNNLVCVQVDTDTEGYKFMNVHKPTHVSLTIQSDGTLVVSVNNSCIFRCGQPGQLEFEDNCVKHDKWSFKPYQS